MRVTDGRTDRQADRRTDTARQHAPLCAYASRGKNLDKEDEEWPIQARNISKIGSFNRN